VRNDYVRAVGQNNFTKFPSRFPVFYRNVEQINVTQHRAFSSVRVEGEFVAVKTYTDVKDIPLDQEKLRAAGFTPEVLDDVLFKSLVIRKRAPRTVLTEVVYSAGSVTRHGSSSLTRFTGQSAITLSTW